MDYSKYTKGGAQSGAAGGVYKQYMDYQKYMKGGAQGGGSGGDYKKYMDYSKYMNGGAQGGGNPTVLVTSHQSGPASAVDCNTTEQLKAWHDQQVDRVDQYTPKAYQHFAQAPIEEQYRKNLIRITGEPERAPTPTSAMYCKTEDQLKAWRKAQEEQIKQYVPKGFEKNALKPIEQEYEKNIARIKGAEPNKDSSHGELAEKSVAKSDESDDNAGARENRAAKGNDPAEDGKKSDDHDVEKDEKKAEGAMPVADVVAASAGTALSAEKAEGAAPSAGAMHVLPVMFLFAFGVPTAYTVTSHILSRGQRTLDDAGATF
mmetsp:Transcript_100806/g.256478  ORF Transcript_100806/g.256478 Transcript_100806/m.256478 type:complete len:317 (+) Transcript_100806:2-952(+)